MKDLEKLNALKDSLDNIANRINSLKQMLMRYQSVLKQSGIYQSLLQLGLSVL